jgi:hypothetical protein
VARRLTGRQAAVRRETATALETPRMRENCRVMTLIWVVLIVAAVIALASIASSSNPWEDYGKGHLVMDRDPASGPREGSAGTVSERDEEIRQMLEAKRARQARRGQPPLDVEAELRRLTRPKIDPQLREEIRDLVVARNYRRTRAGKPPLDVEAEIERQISRLDDVG